MSIKKNIFLLLFIAPFFSFSQNLEYNKVLLVSNEQTVPIGKVWKITNVLPNLTGAGNLKILVNDIDIIVAFSHSTNTATGYHSHTNNHNYYNSLNGAYWLPEGTTLKAADNVQYISVIEFNE